MKKILPVLLLSAVVLGACANKTSTEPAESSAATEAVSKETEKETEEETTEESVEETTADGISAVYAGDGKLPVVEIDGRRYFDYSADDFLDKLNANAEEVMKEPAVYENKGKEDNQVMIVSDKDVICMLEMDPDDKKIAQVYIMAKQSDDFGLSDLAIEAAPILMVLDPNMEARYAGLHLVDIASAAQIGFGQSQYAYEGEHEGIRELIYGEEDFIIFNFAPAGDTEGQETVAAAAAPVGEKPDFGPLSDDIYSFQIQVDDDVYQLPMTYDQFRAFGWEYDGDDTVSISSESRTTTNVFKKGSLTCYVGMMNFDVNARPLNECHVTSIKFDSFLIKDNEITLTLPGGATYGGSLETAIALYGTPYYEYDNGTTRKSVTYQLSSYQEVKIGSEYEKLDVIGEIEVENISKPADFISGPVSSDVPAIISKYQAPSKLSDDFGDFIVEYGGDLYQLPAPVSVFTANGWKVIEDASETTISGKDSSWVTIMKDNQKLKVLAKNYDENATAITNGFVTDVVSDVYSSKTPIKITKNISVGMSRSELESALSGVEYESEDSSSFDYYNIYPTGSKVDYYSISVSKETDAVTKVTVKYAPKFSEYVE